MPYSDILSFGVPQQQQMGLPAMAQTGAGMFGMNSQYLPTQAQGLQGQALGMPTSADFGSFAPGFQNTNTAPSGPSWFSDANNLNAAFQGISALSSAYLGFQQMKHAKDTLRFQKEAYNTNMNNSIQSYNTSLEDRIRGRTSNPNEADVQSYLDKNKLSRSGG